VTLACRDIRRMAAFYRQFGWPEGNVWDVAFKYGSEFDHRGGFVYP
jgi:hypothetical protein